MRKDLLKGTCLFDIHNLTPNLPILLTQDAVPHERANVTVELTYMPFVKGDDGESKDGRSRAATDDSDPTVSVPSLRACASARLPVRALGEPRVHADNANLAGCCWSSSSAAVALLRRTFARGVATGGAATSNGWWRWQLTLVRAL